MSLPVAASARARAETSNAVSVPIESILAAVFMAYSIGSPKMAG